MLLGLLTSEQVLIRDVSVIAWRLDYDRNIKSQKRITLEIQLREAGLLRNFIMHRNNALIDDIEIKKCKADWRNKTMSREFLQKQLTDKKKGLIAYGENDFGNDRQWMPKT